MKWTVTYLPSAKDDLATIWINALDRKAVTNSANSIDHLLGTKNLLNQVNPGQVKCDF